jgi:hypothetical protein
MCTIFLIQNYFYSKLQKFEMSEKFKTSTNSRRNLTAVVVHQIIFKLYWMLSWKIQVPNFMLEMVMVAQQQIVLPFSKKGSVHHAVQAAGS